MRKKFTEPEDYCVLTGKNDKRLSNFERLTLVGGGELDKAVSWISKQFESFSTESGLHSVTPELLQEATAFYRQFTNNPQAFYGPQPPVPTDVTETVLHVLPAGRVVDLEFQSAWTPRYPNFAAPNYETSMQRVHARYWKHDSAPKATIIAVHGWMMGDQRINSLAFLPGLFYREGYDMVLLELPFHGRRKVDTKFLFPSGDFVLTNEVMGEVITNLRQLHALIRSRQSEPTPIGPVGMSLGAYCSALWASLDPLDFVIPIVPLASMAELVWEIVANKPEFQAIVAAGISLEALEEVYRLHSPLAFAPATPIENQFIVAGLGDRIVPARQPKLLWDHWKRPKLYWFSGGHVAQFQGEKAFRQILDFLESKVVATAY